MIQDPAIVDALSALPTLQARLHFLDQRDRSFAGDLIDYARRKGYLTPKQAPYVHKLLQKSGGNESAPIEPEPVVAIGDVSGIIALFNKAAAHLKAPGVVMSLEGTGTIKVFVGKPRTKFAGKTVVQDYDTKVYPQVAQTYGIINADGGFEPKPGVKTPEHMIETLQAFAADPAKHAAAYGRLTGRCCFCRNRLTDPRSSAQGWGETCADHFDLPWGDRPAKGTVFLAVDAAPDKGTPDLTGFEVATGNESAVDPDDSPHGFQVVLPK